MKAWSLILIFCVLLLGSLDALGLQAVRPENRCTRVLDNGVSRARYYQPQTGRFWTMDSFEGNEEDPLSLHKYSYCHGNAVNGTDPSGHFELNFVSLLTSVNIGETVDSGEAFASAMAKRWAMRRIQKAFAQSTINALVVLAATAVTVGGYEIADGYAVSQQFERIKTETAKRSNPTGSAHAYVNFECDAFEKDAEEHFRREGKNPQKISFTAHENAIVGDEIRAAFGWRTGLPISESGYHEGCLVDGWVYDNFLPFGVPRRIWEKYSYFVQPQDQLGNYISLRKAHNKQYGVIVPSPSAF